MEVRPIVGQFTTPDPVDKFDAVFQELIEQISRSYRAVDGPWEGLLNRAENEVDEHEGTLLELAAQMARHRSEVEAYIARGRRVQFRWIDVSLALVGHAVRLLNNPEFWRGPDEVRSAFVLAATRAMSVGHEVLALMRAGYPSGALGRWRTLHELAVICEVLRIGNRHTARRYLEHRVIGLARLIDAGAISPNPELRADILRARARLLRRFGRTYAGDYGWAAELTRRKLGAHNPTFGHLMKLAADNANYGLRALRDHANHDVHGTALGNLRLIAEDGNVHPGAQPFDSHRYRQLTAATVACLGGVAAQIGYVAGNYSHARRLRMPFALVALADEVIASGGSYAWAMPAFPGDPNDRELIGDLPPDHP